jgi:SAM-dependent methyltransferase
MPDDLERPLRLLPAQCGVCGCDSGTEVGAGYDYEYKTAPDTFHALRCPECGTVYLNPRPDISEFARIYPSSYHSLDFTPQNYSFVHKIRSRLEARRLLRYCRGAPPEARILDIGCGDGFHLRLLSKFGDPSWQLEGVDIDARAVARATSDGLTVHIGTIEELELPEMSYDVLYTLQTIEHVADPSRLMVAAFRLLKPGGRLVIVTDNTGSLDYWLFRRSYWGGYHFPRHWNLFNAASITRLGERTGFYTERIETIVSPVNWTYSIHNFLVDRQAPQWLISRFTLKSPVTLAAFTMLDIILQKFGRGALLNVHLTRPIEYGHASLE